MSSRPPTEYKLDELARAAGVSPRTVRYYVQRGLLAAPVFRAKDTAYGPEHLLRLRAIKRLQEEFLPLDAIASRLAFADDAELRAIADGKSSRAEAPHAPPPPREATGEGVTRYALADGVELLVSSRASAESRERVFEVLKAFEPSRPTSSDLDDRETRAAGTRGTHNGGRR